jgi:hypothetical protein
MGKIHNFLKKKIYNYEVLLLPISGNNEHVLNWFIDSSYLFSLYQPIDPKNEKSEN